ncbi:MAG: alpha/beta fold hydrolase [Burkholderiaceae bacterium]
MQSWKALMAAIGLAVLVGCGDNHQQSGDHTHADSGQRNTSSITKDQLQLGDGDQAINLAFERWPSRTSDTRAPIVLLHEFGFSLDQWRGIAPALTASGEVIALDLRGHGGSDKSACCYEINNFASDVVAALDALNIKQAILVGAGGGGVVAQRVAANEPARVKRLVLVASAATARDNPAYQAVFADAQRFDPAQDGPAPDDFLAAYNQGAILGDDSRATLLAAQRKVPRGLWAPLLANLAANDHTADLRKIEVPVLMLWGKTDPLFAQSSRTRLENGLRSDVSVVNGFAGRYPAFNRPEAATVVNRFLAPRGTLHSFGPPEIRTRDQLNSLTANGIERLLLREVTGDADCDVEVRTIKYQTVGGAGESTTATAGIAVPVGDNPVCRGDRPLLLYAHGTSPRQDYDVTQSREGFNGLAAAVFAARGYVVVAPNYTGYGDSWLDYHPYLNAQAQAEDMVDALRAARELFTAESRVTPRQLFISGYSQGGYVAMATHRLMELSYPDEFAVTASFPMSGPYSLEQTVLETLSGRDVDGASPLFAYISDSYQRSYGNLYESSAELFEAPYDLTAPGLFPGNLSASDSVISGLLPERLLAGQGGPHLLTQAYVNQVLSNPENPLRQAVRLNTLHNWAPRAPMAMCGGGKDQTVFFDNTFRAQDAFRALGVEVPYFDFNNSASLPSGRTNTLYLRFRSIFLFRRNLEGYHVALAPYCARMGRDFFNQFLIQ